MSQELYFSALERTIAEVVGQFEGSPDIFLRPVDLRATLFYALQRQQVLAKRYVTRDGRRTSLVHRRYPTFTYASDLGTQEHSLRGHSDIVVLSPSFVRSHPFDALVNAHHRGTRALHGHPEEEHLRPLLAAVDFRLIEGFTPAVLDGLETDLYALARRQPDASRCYMGIFCRHWDLDNHIRKALLPIERWASTMEHVSLVVVQSYYDDIGRVFGGRYLNRWSHMAPLPPLEPPYAPLPRRGVDSTAYTYYG